MVFHNKIYQQFQHLPRYYSFDHNLLLHIHTNVSRYVKVLISYYRYTLHYLYKLEYQRCFPVQNQLNLQSKSTITSVLGTCYLVFGTWQSAPSIPITRGEGTRRSYRHTNGKLDGGLHICALSISVTDSQSSRQ